MIKNKKLIATLVIYCILFYGFWTVFELLIKNQLLALTGNNDIVMEFIRSGIIKNLVWTVPAIILVKKFESDMYIGLKEMFTTKINFLQILPIFILCIIYCLAAAFRSVGISIKESFGWSQIIIVIFVGITEEMVFRGWLLNSTLKNADKEWKQWLAVGINSVMFLCIHFPIWIHDGVFFTNLQGLAFMGIIILSFIFSWLFIKTRNILVPVALHMLYDLLIFMLIG